MDHHRGVASTQLPHLRINASATPMILKAPSSRKRPSRHAALDAAALFRLALERAEPGTAWHAVADGGDRSATLQR